MKLVKTSAGNYQCWYRGYYIFIFKRPHGGWAAIMTWRGMTIDGNGFFATSMPTLKHVKNWIVNG